MMNINLTSWQASESDIQFIRESIVIHELGIPASVWDDQDKQRLHALATMPWHGAVAKARLLPGGQVGRMAVLANWRNQGTRSCYWPA